MPALVPNLTVEAGVQPDGLSLIYVSACQADADEVCNGPHTTALQVTRWN